MALSARIRTHHKSLLAWGLVVLLVLSAFAFRVLNTDEPVTVAVVRGDVVQQISVTGKARPVQEVQLGFQTGGTIERVYAVVSDHVESGTLLATLNSAELQAALRQAEASRDAEYARLQDLRKGTRVEDIAVSEAKLASALSSLKEADRTLANALRAAYTTADDAIRSRADQFMSTPAWNPVLIVTPSNSQLKTNIEGERSALSSDLSAWSVLIASLSELTLAHDATDATMVYLIRVQSYLALLSQSVSTLSSSNGVSQSTIDSYRADVVVARSAVDAAITALQSAKTAFTAARDAYTVAERSLELAKAGATPETLVAQESRVRQSEAQVESIKAQLQNTRLVSPIAGVVTAQDSKVGQIAVPGQPLISIVSDADLEIEAFVPEINIGKVARGNDVRISFDAYPGEMFQGKVVSIDPAETVLNGVANFKVTIGLTSADSRLRSGLTADVTIIRAVRSNVTVVPSYALEPRDGYAEVQRLVAGVLQLVQVEVGLSGKNGFTEVLSGLEEGDEVVLPF